MIKALVFDCFGVLLGNPLLNRLLALDETDSQKADQVRAVGHAADMGILSYDESLQAIAQILDCPVDDLRQERDRGEVRNQQLIDYILSLKDQYVIGLLSNVSGRDRLDARFLAGQLDQLFDVVIASGDVGYVKPEPEIYELMLNRLEVEASEAVMIDDIQTFCDGAKAVGMQSIRFISNRQLMTDLQHLIDRGR